MKMFIRNALLGAAGLVALSLPAHAVGSATVADAPLVKSNTAQQQLTQVPYDPYSAGSFSHGQKKKTHNQSAPYDPSAGSVGFKKTKKKKATE
jgi:hypothetical protein